MKKKYVLPAIFALLISPLSGTISVSEGYLSMIHGDSTLIGGRISENTTWILGGSPYIVVEDVIVDRDVYLTIEAGVKVKFASARNLVIDGGILANGNSTHEILFTSNNTTPSRGDWGTINIRHYSSILNIFDHVQVKYASSALVLAADCNLTASTLEDNNKGVSLEDVENLHIAHCQIVNNTEQGIEGSVTWNVTAEDCIVSANGEGVVLFLGDDWPPICTCYIESCSFSGNRGLAVGIDGGNVYIENCNVSKNQGSGISLAPTGDSHVKNCHILANEGYGVSTYVRSSSIALRIHDCIISDNIVAGLTGSADWELGARVFDAWNCTFLNNTIGVAVGAADVSGCLTNCTIRGNTKYGIKVYAAGGISMHDAAVSVYECIIQESEYGIICSGQGFHTVKASDSIICNNTRSGIALHAYFAWASLNNCTIKDNLHGVEGWSSDGLSASFTTIADNNLANINITVSHADPEMGNVLLEYCNVSNSLVGVKANSGSIRYSNIYNNSLVNIDLIGSALLEYCNVSDSFLGIRANGGEIKHCNICNHEEYNVENTGTSDVNALYNWWGTANGTLIAELIWDYYDDYNLGRVLYEPYLTAPFTIPWDITGPTVWVSDGKCDMRDVAQVAKLFGSLEGDGKYDVRADITGPAFLVADGKIDMRDVALVAKHYGEIYW